MKKAFTLVELMIVVAILGILAAMVIPEFQNHAEKAREAATKDNLRILRNAIELYSVEHTGVAPGHPGNDTSVAATGIEFFRQMVDPGQYMSEMPDNPFKQNQTINVVALIPAAPDGVNGWIYCPSTKEFRCNSDGTDSEGIAYFDY